MTGRPKLEGLRYFPIDIDMFDDPKILFIENSFGEIGELVVIKLLCWIYRNGYFCEWNEEVSLVFAKKNFSSIKASVCNAVVSELIRRGFFDKDIFVKHGVLTSKGIQDRWLHAIKQSKRNSSLSSKFKVVSSEESTLNKEESALNKEESEHNIIYNNIIYNTPLNPPNEIPVDCGAEAAGSGWGDFFNRMERDKTFYDQCWEDFFAGKKKWEQWVPKDALAFKMSRKGLISKREASFCNEFFEVVRNYRDALSREALESESIKKFNSEMEKLRIEFDNMSDDERTVIERETIERLNKEGEDVDFYFKHKSRIKVACVETMRINRKIIY